MVVSSQVNRVATKSLTEFCKNLRGYTIWQRNSRRVPEATAARDEAIGELDAVVEATLVTTQTKRGVGKERVTKCH